MLTRQQDKEAFVTKGSSRTPIPNTSQTPGTYRASTISQRLQSCFTYPHQLSFQTNPPQTRLPSPISHKLLQSSTAIMQLDTLIAAFAAAMLTVGPAMAIAMPEPEPETSFAKRAASLDNELFERDQCTNIVNVPGSGCSHRGRTSCSADRHKVVSSVHLIPYRQWP